MATKIKEMVKIFRENEDLETIALQSKGEKLIIRGLNFAGKVIFKSNPISVEYWNVLEKRFVSDYINIIDWE